MKTFVLAFAIAFYALSFNNDAKAEDSVKFTGVACTKRSEAEVMIEAHSIGKKEVEEKYYKLASCSASIFLVIPLEVVANKGSWEIHKAVLSNNTPVFLLVRKQGLNI